MSIPFLPPNRPRLTREKAERLLEKSGLKPSEMDPAVMLLGVRGYYHDDHGDNQRGVYDDAIFLLTPTAFVAFNANTDPSAFRHGIASLKPGRYLYKLGIHGLSKPKDRQYEALVQAGEVTVCRDGGEVETGWFGINIHRGGASGTSSLGCQTIPPAQWESFISMVRAELKRHGQKTIPYILTT